MADVDVTEKKLPTLRELRKERCLEVPDVSKVVGVRDNTMYRWERGAAAPSLLDALTLAKFYNRRVEQINWWPHGVLD